MISDADKTKINDAIRAAESKTSGELYCVLAQNAGGYRLVPIAWASALALVVPWPLVASTTWSAITIYVIQLVVFAVAAIGLSQPGVRFRIVPGRTKRERAHAAAMRQFWAHGMHKTQKRTGVLIFAAVAERYVEIIADAGINAKVSQEVWDAAIASLVSAIKAGRPGDGFVAAIEQCGAVLAQHFPIEPSSVNPDELPDRLVEI
ncbi:MAG: putative rane protein [Bradyrhizobium sp.]|jgi:putative membrane protein|nr:putative rane protein [Bradyrhizobium sp.]